MTTPEQRPRLFIGSSTESLTLAYEIQSALEYSCEPTVWTQGVFQLTRSSLESLRTALDDYDFAVFVLAPDDLSTLRDTQQLTVRDNVLLELGLFLGKLGSDCVFMVAPREEPGGLRLPTDLLGIHVGTYEPNRSDGNFSAALGPACAQIQTAILTKSRPRYPEQVRQRLASLDDRFRARLIERIQELPVPKDFPMPPELERLSARELNECGGDPATDLDLYKARNALDDAESRLTEWSGG